MANEVTPPKPGVSEPSPQPGATKLGPANSFNGTLEGQEDTVIEGRFQGRISLPSSALTVGRGAKVEAEVKVRTLTLLGELTGTVTAERVVVSETARMTGDIRTVRISISNGAQFKGGIKIEKP